MRVFLTAGAVLALSLIFGACADSNDHGAGHDPSPGAVTPTTPTADQDAHAGHGMDLMDDQMFLAGMIEHHQGAIDMAEIALERAEHDEIRELSQEIITSQQTEIERMETWHQQWFNEDAANVEHGIDNDDMGMGMDTEELETADPFDQAFIDAMIPHHEGATDMAEQILDTTERPELRELAQGIITAQEAEIEQMREWRQGWYGQ